MTHIITGISVTRLFIKIQILLLIKLLKYSFWGFFLEIIWDEKWWGGGGVQAFVNFEWIFSF